MYMYDTGSQICLGLEDPSRNMSDCVTIEMMIVTCSKSIIIKILIAVCIDFLPCSELMQRITKVYH